MIRKVACCFILAIILINVLTGRTYAENSEVFYRIETNDKKIALTFDDGPHPRITKQILDILDSYGVTATFFVIGQNVVNYPEAMELISNSGCEIGNHTYSHKRFGNMSVEQMKSEFERCRKTLSDDFGVEPTLMRPPEGFCSKELCLVSDQMNYDVILWSIDTLDWARTPASVIADNVLKNARGGDIILMHDYTSGGCHTCEALGIIIPALIERGFEFVTVSELIEK